MNAATQEKLRSVYHELVDIGIEMDAAIKSEPDRECADEINQLRGHLMDGRLSILALINEHSTNKAGKP